MNLQLRPLQPGSALTLQPGSMSVLTLQPGSVCMLTKLKKWPNVPSNKAAKTEGHPNLRRASKKAWSITGKN